MYNLKKIKIKTTIIVLGILSKLFNVFMFTKMFETIAV